MNRAYDHKIWEESFRRSRKAIFLAASFIAGLLLLAPPAARPALSRDQRLVISHTIDKAAIENLQRSGERWARVLVPGCPDGAFKELRRIAPDFSGGPAELQGLPLQTEILTGTKAIFTWTPMDGRARYRLTVERYAWLLPIAGERDRIIWVPVRTEIVAHP